MLGRGGAAALRAWPCGDVHQAGSLLPFLFHTSTIQHRSYTRVSRGVRSTRPPTAPGNTVYGGRDSRSTAEPRRSPRRSSPSTNASPFEHSRDGARPGYDDAAPRERPQRATPVREDHVPFENALDNQEAGPDSDKSTVTPRERKAFEKLFTLRKQPVDSPAKDGSKKSVAKPGRDVGLDAILDSAMSNIEKERHPPPQFPTSLRPLAEEARAQQQASRGSHKDKKNWGTSRDEAGIHRVLDQADNDVTLWHLLNKHVLDRVAALRLDSPTSPRQKALQDEATQRWQQTRKGHPAGVRRNYAKQPDADLMMLTVNLPAHLLHFMNRMRTHYPASILPLNLLPSLKSLGPSAFALGASTALYNAHMTVLHHHYPTNLTAILDTLTEMDREVYAFDDETLAVIEKVLKEIGKWRNGHSGPAVQLLFSTARIRKGMEGLREFRTLVEERRQEEALRRAREAEAERDEEAAAASEAAKGGLALLAS